jgi:SnoaL-like domain
METQVNNELSHLMERNVLEVFGERDSERRKSVINELYTENCTFNDMDSDAPSVGRLALNAKVEHLLKPVPGFVFRVTGPAQVIQEVGRLRWQFGPDGAAPVVMGMDVAIFEQGRIRSLYAFLDAAPSKSPKPHEI